MSGEPPTISGHGLIYVQIMERRAATIEDEVPAALSGEARATLRRLLQRSLEGSPSDAVEPFAAAAL